MKVKITSTEPSRLPQAHPHHTEQISLTAPALFFGRANPPQEQCQHTLPHKSISRTHAKLLFPNIPTKQAKFRHSKVFTHSGIPTYLWKIDSNSRLSRELLQIVWQFLQPAEIIVLQDLSSKYGLFVKLERLVLQVSSNHNIIKNQIKQENLLFDPVQSVKTYMQSTLAKQFEAKVQGYCIQLGSQKNLEVLGIKNYKIAIANGSENLTMLTEFLRKEKIIPEDCRQEDLTYIGKAYLKSPIHVNQQQDNNCLAISLLVAKLSSSNIVLLPQKPHCQIIVFIGVPPPENSLIVYSLGRDRRCDLQINKSQISRKQLEISHDTKNQTWEIKDLNSTNGSWLKCQKGLFKVSEFLHNRNDIDCEQQGEEEAIQLGEGDGSDILNIPSFLLDESEPTPTIAIQFKLGEVRMQVEVPNYEADKKKIADAMKTNSNSLSYEKILEGISREEGQQGQEDCQQGCETSLLNQRIDDQEESKHLHKQAASIQAQSNGLQQKIKENQYQYQQRENKARKQKINILDALLQKDDQVNLKLS